MPHRGEMGMAINEDEGIRIVIEDFLGGLYRLLFFFTAQFGWILPDLKPFQGCLEIPPHQVARHRQSH
jgi:hypothetical protein